MRLVRLIWFVYFVTRLLYETCLLYAVCLPWRLVCCIYFKKPGCCATLVCSLDLSTIHCTWPVCFIKFAALLYLFAFWLFSIMNLVNYAKLVCFTRLIYCIRLTCCLRTCLLYKTCLLCKVDSSIVYNLPACLSAKEWCVISVVLESFVCI